MNTLSYQTKQSLNYKHIYNISWWDKGCEGFRTVNDATSEERSQCIISDRKRQLASGYGLQRMDGIIRTLKPPRSRALDVILFYLIREHKIYHYKKNKKIIIIFNIYRVTNPNRFQLELVKRTKIKQTPRTALKPARDEQIRCFSSAFYPLDEKLFLAPCTPTTAIFDKTLWCDKNFTLRAVVLPGR